VNELHIEVTRAAIEPYLRQLAALRMESIEASIVREPRETSKPTVFWLKELQP
jgi:hypothetical protein